MSKTTTITIRPAKQQDIAHCLGLDSQLQTDTVWQMQQREDATTTTTSFQVLRLPRPIQVSYPRNAPALQQDLSTLNGLLVAESSDIILGYAQTHITTADQNAWVRNLVVDEPYRRHHIGSALLAQSKKWAARQGATYILLETTIRSYPSIQFMQARGLKFCGYNDHYYPSQDIAVFFGQNL